MTSRATAQATADLHVGVRAAVNAVAAAIRDEANRNVRRVLGPDQRLSGQAGKGRPVRVVATPARTDRDAAVVRAVGPWQLIERRRKGGYLIRPRRADALTIAGRVVEEATGGAITRPRAPITSTFAKVQRAPKPLETVAANACKTKVRPSYG